MAYQARVGRVATAKSSVRAVVCLAKPGAHGVTRPTFPPLNAAISS